MSKQLPYYKMYPADADSDERFRLMNMEERGLYWTLLNHAWINDGIPFETDKLARLVGISEDLFKQLWRIVGECFYLDGVRLRNKRQEAERVQARQGGAHRLVRVGQGSIPDEVLEIALGTAAEVIDVIEGLVQGRLEATLAVELRPSPRDDLRVVGGPGNAFV